MTKTTCPFCGEEIETLVGWHRELMPYKYFLDESDMPFVVVQGGRANRLETVKVGYEPAYYTCPMCFVILARTEEEAKAVLTLPLAEDV